MTDSAAEHSTSHRPRWAAGPMLRQFPSANAAVANSLAGKNDGGARSDARIDRTSGAENACDIAKVITPKRAIDPSKREVVTITARSSLGGHHETYGSPVGRRREPRARGFCCASASGARLRREYRAEGDWQTNPDRRGHVDERHRQLQGSRRRCSGLLRLRQCQWRRSRTADHLPRRRRSESARRRGAGRQEARRR